MLRLGNMARSPLTYAAGTLIGGATTASLYMNTGSRTLETAIDCQSPESQRLQKLGLSVCDEASKDFLLDSSATLAGLAATSALIVAAAFTGYRSLKRRVVENDVRLQASILPTDQQSTINS